MRAGIPGVKLFGGQVVYMVQYIIDQNDFLASQYLHLRWSKRALIWNGICYPSTILIIYWTFSHLYPRIDFTYIFWISFGHCIVTLLYWVVYIPRQSRKQYVQIQHLKDPTNVTWDDKVLTLQGKSYWSEHGWENIRKWKQNRKYYLLYPTDQSYILIPKRAFSDVQGLNSFEALLLSKVKYISE